MTLAREKWALFFSLAVAVVLAYFGSLHTFWYADAVIPATPLDGAIPFWPMFVFPYLSFYLLAAAPLLVIHDRQRLRDIAYGFCLIVAVSTIVFLLWPNRIEMAETNALVQACLAGDLDRNACPSLHASLALYAALASRRGLISAWTIVVIASTLLIKHHVVIDVVAGMLLGWVVYRIVVRPERVEGPDSEPVRETLQIRRELVRESPDVFARLSRLDGRRRAFEFAVFVSLAAIGMLVGGYVRPVGIAITAIALNTFPLLMHEGMHGVLFTNRRWNWIASVLLGATFLMSFTAYRVLHLRHHRYLGDPRDPDDYHNYSRSRHMVWFLHFVRLSCGSLLYVFLIPALAMKYGSRSQRRLVCVEYTILLGIYSLLLRVFPLRELFLTWIVPLLVVGTLVAIRGFTQHGITEASDPYLASRTMLPNRVLQFFLINENYHLEHHLFPEVPSYHLAELHQTIWPKLPRAVAGKSYLAFLAAFLRATPRMDETPIGRVAPSERAS
jgi:fatty acid desaturase